MPGNIELQNQADQGNTINDNMVSSSEADRQAIFAERFATLTDGFGKACEEQKVSTAIAIAIHPEENRPIIFVRGHTFDIAELTGKVLRQINDELMSRLSGH